MSHNKITDHKSIPNGVWAVAITPFDHTLKINWDAYARLINFYLAAGVDGIFTCCASSEVFDLTDKECVELTKQASDIIDGRVPIIAGAMGSTDVKNLAEQAKKLSDVGAAAVSVSPCLLAAPHETDDILKLRFEALMGMSGDVPLGTYECPVPYKRFINGQLFGWVASSNRFIFHKDTTCNTTAIRIKLEASRGTKMKLFNANMLTLPESMRDGLHGYCGVATNLYPDLVVTLCGMKDYADPIYTELFEFLVRADTVMGAAYPVSAKIALDSLGVTMGRSCRMKTTPVGSQMIGRIRSVLDEAEGFRARLGTPLTIQRAS